MQRAAAARMLVREPALLVFADLSSALDVETERLGSGLGATEDGGQCCTCYRPPSIVYVLAVSHRRSALQRADWFIVLQAGRVAAQKHLSDLLASSAELRELWRSEQDQ